MGRYEILERIGAGGMAEVYKAKDTALNRYVAVKVLRSEYGSDETFVRKFRVEAQSAAGLSHPNIVSVYDVGEENDIYFIVMELVEGITLKNYIDMKGKLDIKEALNISVQIAQGLSAAHAKRIIHRDIKPQNIIISRDGKVKVTDFGIARMADSTTVTTTAAGTVSYISPEQARGGYSDEKSDIYSLGITMYEMLTGKVPYEGETNVAVALMHIHGNMTPPGELEPSIPKSFEKIILKCTQKKPEWRYASAHELIADLRKVLTHPDGDYVVIPGMADAAGSTIMMSDSDMAKLNDASPAGGSGSDLDEDAAGDEDAADSLNSRRPYKQDSSAAADDGADKLIDEEEEEVDSHMGKVLMTMGIVGFVILIIVLIVLAAYVSGLIGGGFSLFGKSSKETAAETSAITTQLQTTETQTQSQTETDATVIVPNLLGKTQSEAEKLLSDNRLEVETKDGTSDYYSAGQVYKQSVEAGTSVDAHTTVTIYISKGSQSFKLDDVAGINYERATDMLQAEGLKVKLKFIDNNTVNTDEVAYTDPKSGSSVVEGDTITLYVSQGQAEETVTVPDVRGKDLDTAVSEITAAGLTYNGKSSDYSDTYSKGQVMDQSLTAGKSVEKNATMSVTVSLGSKVSSSSSYTSTVDVPDPYSYGAASDGDEGELKIVIKQDGSSTTVYDQTVSQDSVPSTINVKSSSNSTGTATAYFNGEQYDSWSVSYE